MNNNTNIYDIDGEMIREAGNNSHFTIDELRKIIEKYQAKLQNGAEKLDSIEDPAEKAALKHKLEIYRTYIRNLNASMIEEFKHMTPEQLANALKQTEETKDVETQVKEAIDELKEEIESEESITEDPATEPECDSTEEPKPTIMDEYVQFEEIPKE